MYCTIFGDLAQVRRETCREMQAIKIRTKPLLCVDSFCNNRVDGKPRTAAIVGHVDPGGDLAALNPVRIAGDVPSFDQVRALGRRLDICPYPLLPPTPYKGVWEVLPLG